MNVVSGQFTHADDVSSRFVVFDMFDTLVRIRDDIGVHDIVKVLHTRYLSEYEYGDLERLFDEKVTGLIFERRADDKEVVFIEVLEHILTGLGLPDLYDPPFLEKELFAQCRFSSAADGAEDTLRFFKENGYRIGVLSNSFFLGSTLRSCLADFGLDVYVDAVVSSADIIFMKPRAEAYGAVLEVLCAKPEDTFFIGDDRVNDYLGPLMYGMRPIHISLGGDPMDVHVVSIGDVPALFNLD